QPAADGPVPRVESFYSYVCGLQPCPLGFPSPSHTNTSHDHEHDGKRWLMGSGLFITGTDTGVGKTLVACGFARLFKFLGYKVGVMKPTESGCEEKGGKLFPRDASYLKEASGCG